MSLLRILALACLPILLAACTKTDKTTGTIEIVVRDGTQWSPTNTEGLPAINAEVTLYIKSTDYRDNAPAYTGISNAEGKVVFNDLKPGDYYYVVKKGDMLNFFDPLPIADYPIAYQATGIFQSQAQINTTVHLTGAEPGDFIFADRNGDGLLNHNDKYPVPFGVSVSAGETTNIKSFIGYTFNHALLLFQSKEHVQQVLDNLYSQVGSWQQLQVVMDGMLSDDAGCAGLPQWCALDNFTYSASNTIIASFWQKAYTNISLLNRVILNVPRLNLAAAEAGQLIAQAKAMRGYIYLHMAQYFGGVALQEGPTTGDEIIRSTLEETLAFAQKDLSEAAGALPATWTGTERRRIGAYACKLLLARLAIQQRNHLQAAQFTDALVQSGQYQLVSPAQIFTSDDNSEIVWNMTPGLSQDYNVFFSDTVIRNFAPALRYSEALLINSEAYLELNDLNKVAQNLNTLRARRNLPPLTLTNKTEATEALRITWKNEQYKEGQRFIKLVQWNLAVTVLGSKGMQFFNQKLPIPLNVLISSRNMHQNPGY